MEEVEWSSGRKLCVKMELDLDDLHSIYVLSRMYTPLVKNVIDFSHDVQSIYVINLYLILQINF